ncbi:MAG TPA: hypothetical protein VJA21_18520 [Verrucomicrobiae bacterium]
MKTPIPRLARTVLLAGAILAAGWCRAEENNQILFLHLRLKGDAIALVSSAVKPGRLKTPVAPDKTGGLELELMSTNRAKLWSDVIHDPTVRRFEYEDPDRPGELKVKEVKVTEIEFTVRVPYHEDGGELKVYRLERQATRAEAAVSGRAKKLLGSIKIPQPKATP